MGDYGKWIRIKDQIVSDILTGKYKPYITENCGKLPSIVEIAEIYDCGRSTAQKVLNELCNSGILIRKKGVGYFIKPLVKEKLRNGQRREIKKGLECITAQAKNIGIAMQDFTEMFQGCLDSIYSR